MSKLRRIITSYGRCRRYAPFFEIHIIDCGWDDERGCWPNRQRFTWFATAKLRNGRLFCRALNADVSQLGVWRVRDGAIGSRKVVSDITEAFATWMESVEDELGNVAFRALVQALGEEQT